MKERSVRPQKSAQTATRRRSAYVSRLNRGDSRWFFNVSMPHAVIDGFADMQGVEEWHDQVDQLSAAIAEAIEETFVRYTAEGPME